MESDLSLGVNYFKKKGGTTVRVDDKGQIDNHY
jgi:hypothetical protein